MIPLITHGRSTGFTEPIVARVARTPEADPIRRASAVLVTDGQPALWPHASQYRGAVTKLAGDQILPAQSSSQNPLVHTTESTDHLKSGDVVVLMPRSGVVRTIYRPDSDHNFLFATQRCNSFCLMCSQPPVDRDDSVQVQINLEMIRLVDTPPKYLGITGGEPTLLGNGLLRILTELKTCMPDTRVHMLTNGRRFAKPEFTDAFLSVGHPNLTLGIPVYSDYAPHHDYIVQARGAFDQTIQGLHRLARYDQPVEIRVVLHKLTLPRLLDLAQFIYRNLPFAYHVALMGLEITGFTKPNIDELWIDPYDYQRELALAVEYLDMRGMSVSVYNHPLCLLPRALWKFARKSISDWKNMYLKQCEDCGARQDCGGFFMSAQRRRSTHIRAM